MEVDILQLHSNDVYRFQDSYRENISEIGGKLCTAGEETAHIICGTKIQLKQRHN